MAVTFNKKIYKEIPTTILGVIIGTHLIVHANESEGDQEHQHLMFGFVPNDKGREVLGTAACELLDLCAKRIDNRYNWSLLINHESGGISITADYEEEDNEEEDNEDDEEEDDESEEVEGYETEEGYSAMIPDVQWIKLFS